jgi:signal transduction histidine kinase/sugar lactone lactonase YvrE
MLGTYRNKAGEPYSLGSDSVTCLFEDSLGYLWIGLGDGGIDLYQDGGFVHGIKDSDRYFGKGAVISMAEDIKGRIWLGRERGGIAVLEPSTMEISEENDLSGKLISAMIRDRRGLMWLGLKQGGLVTGDHRSQAVRRYAAAVDGDSLEGVLGMGSSSDGRPLVLARSGRLLEFDPIAQGFRSSLALRETEAKDFWVGIASGKLARLPAGLKKSLTVLSVLDDGKGTLWIGTEGGGLVGYDFRENRLSASPILAAREISALAMDKSGRIWVGSRDYGLFALDPGASAYRSVGVDTRHGSGLGSSRIETIFEDSRGRIWIGTGGAGFCSIDPVTGMVNLRGREVGVHDDSVYGITEDRSGRLWILASTGLYCFDTERKDIFLMGEEDGLPGAGFDSGAILAAENGDIWISGEKGVAVFNPDRITRYAPPPDVLISDLVPLGDKDILSRSMDGTEIVLPYDNAGLGFSIAVMDFSSASRNRYALMLEGRQTAWTETGNVNKGYLAPLAPGKYMLRVKAANGNGIWNNYGASLSIVVKSPWWGTWWFESLAFGGIALSVATAVALGARSLRKRNALLAKFARHIEDAREEERKIAARDVHDEIGQYLMALNFNAYWLSAHLDAGEEEKVGKIAEMRQTILGAMDSVKKIAQRLRPLSLEGSDFPDAIRVYIKNFEKMSGIESEVSIGDGWREMPSEFARIFFRILQEMVSNVARHSRAKGMRVEFLSDEQWYILSVQDDGQGMDGSEIDAHDSFGLIGMREACASEGGELELRTGKGRGCAVAAKLPKKSKGRQKDA